MNLHFYIELGLIVVMLAGAYLAMRGIRIDIAPAERRHFDLYTPLNEMEDRTETLFDRRDHS